MDDATLHVGDFVTLPEDAIGRYNLSVAIFILLRIAQLYVKGKVYYAHVEYFHPQQKHNLEAKREILQSYL